MARLPLASALQPKALGLLSCLKLCMCLCFTVWSLNQKKADLETGASLEKAAKYRSSSIFSFEAKTQNSNDLLCPAALVLVKKTQTACLICLGQSSKLQWCYLLILISKRNKLWDILGTE